MKTIKILAKVICVTLLCLSCDNISEKTSVTLSENITLVIDPIYSPRTENSFLLGDYGSYLNYLKDSDYIVGISASKANALSSHKIKSYCAVILIQMHRITFVEIKIYSIFASQNIQ